MGIDKVFAKYERFLLLLMQLLSAGKESIPAGTILHVSQATNNVEGNIQYLRELAVLGMVHNVDQNNYQLSANSGSI